MTVEGGDQTLTLEAGPLPDAEQGVFYDSLVPFDLEPGATVTVSAAGSADVPPFEVIAGFPSSITVSEPSHRSSWTIDRSQDLDVAWSPSGQSFGEVRISLNASDTIECRAPISGGALTIPASLLSALEPTAAATFVISTVSEASVPLDAGRVDLSVRGNVDGQPYLITTLQ